jgi:hypothetical protein
MDSRKQNPQHSVSKTMKEHQPTQTSTMDNHYSTQSKSIKTIISDRHNRKEPKGKLKIISLCFTVVIGIPRANCLAHERPLRAARNGRGGPRLAGNIGLRFQFWIAVQVVQSRP